MKLTDTPAIEIPVFSTTAAAAGYKVGEEGYIDIMFLRSHFTIDETHTPSEVPGNPNMQEQRANMSFAKVAAVTMSVKQAESLIQAIQSQLENLKRT
ncbi:hypothetical protein [Klebsiella pneumoniae]|uniref:hypothetical protein n=1 Tax=Klebsiella pneumoniae TaxID=573 RepID=UPI002FF09757|nr:hypothetical protein [Klebsiella quasipneumoniae subsp. similipneumoniae]